MVNPILPAEHAERVRRRIKSILNEHGQTMVGLIGQTDIVELRRVNTHSPVKVYAKLEGQNPAGSVKDRIALYLIADAIERGMIKPDTVLVEASSGNAGIAIAMVAAVMGLKVLITVPDNVSVERHRLISAYGAELLLTPGAKGTNGAIEKARELSQKPGYYWLSQHFNDVNSFAHYEGTGPEIIKQLREVGVSKLDALVATSGTTGTLMGVSTYLQEHSPETKVFAVWPTGEKTIMGIRRPDGAEAPSIYRSSLIGEVLEVTHPEATAMAAQMGPKEGLVIGPSSGAAVVGALRVAERLKSKGPATVLTIICDWGERYLSLMKS